MDPPSPPGPAGTTATTPNAASSRRSVLDAVVERAGSEPDAIAVEDGGKLLTYAELDTASAAIATALRAAGCKQEEPIGVCLPRSWRAVCAFLGAVRAGAAYVPIGPGYPALRKRELLELAGARRVLTDVGKVDDLPAGAQLLDVETLAAAPSPSYDVATGGDRLAYVLFTSGSTGTPKGVEITHANLLHLLGCGSALLPREGDAVLAVAPLEFDISALEIWGALAVGARLVLAPAGRPDPRELGRLIAERGVTFAFFAAGLFEQVVRAALPDLGGMRLLAAGGDVMAPSAARSLLTAHPGVRVVNGYGPTETSIVASDFEVAEVDGTPLPIGRPLPGYEFHVLDEEEEPVRPGVPGELWIGGPGVGRGYRGDPERTRDRFRPDPYSERPGARLYGSGDRVRVREDGEFEFLGRVDHQVKISGHRVEPEEVEQRLGAHPDVSQAAVLAREDVPGHKRLVAYASLRAGAAAGEADLLAHLGERLPSFMLPATIAVLDELPLTERGKLDRAALPAPARNGAAETESRPAAVAQLMADLLGLDEFGADEDFFAVGGDSLLAIQLVGRLRDRFGADVDVGAVFETPTPRGLAQWLAALGENTRPRLTRSAGPGLPPATFAQRRAWLFERMNPDSTAFQFAALVHLEGSLEVPALADALGELMCRHEIFRTSIEQREGEVVQVVHDEVAVPLEVVDFGPGSGVEWARLVRSRVRVRIALDRAPLVRWTLVRRGPGRWTLIDVEHHAAHDGWSFPVFLSELAELYSARVEDRAPLLPEPAVQLGDYARWERLVADGEIGRRQLDYWRRTVNPDPPLLELSASRSRPARESFAGGSIRRPVPARLATAIGALAREEGATAFQISLAAFVLLLGRCSGLEDVQTGSALANRSDPAAEGLIGMTVGTVALRVDLSGNPTVRELLKRVRGTVLDAISNADVPFERVVEAVGSKRQAHRSPLIQTFFSFDDAPAGTGGWSGLENRVVQTIPNGTAKADLSVIGVDHGEGEPFFIWEHSDLFEDAEADRFAGYHLALLEQLTARPEARIAELRLHDDEEAARLEAWSTRPPAFDRDATVPELVARRATRDPGAVAVLDGHRRLSYGELSERAKRVAGSLRERGVGPGDTVGVLLPRSLETAVAYLGVLEAGAAYVPLDPQHPAARIGKALADAGAKIALADPGLAPDLPAGVAALDPAEAIKGPPASGAAVAGDLAYVMYTSGSTGEPKGVEITHRNIARLVDDPDFVELGPGTVMLHAASPAFDATTLDIWGPLANGGTVAMLAEHPSPDAVAAAVEEMGVNTMLLTAALVHEMVDRRPDCLVSIRHLLSGGDVLSPDHVARALAALPEEGLLTNTYGPTEATTIALVHELRPGDRVDGPIPLGRPIQGTVCEVIDPVGQIAPIGVAGELWIGGDGVARGYRGDPELTVAGFVGDGGRGRRYRSGDRVRRRPDGTLEFLGRVDRQLKVRGVRIEPAEVESAIRVHPAVADALVVPYERAPGESALAAYVVLREGSGAPGAAELREHTVERLPAAMVPAAWIALPRLPLTPTGKVDHHRLPAPSREHLAGLEASGPKPRNGAERRVAASFERVLGIEGVGAEDDFFALGGHSLLAVALFAELDRRGPRLPLSAIFESPTPRALAALIESGTNAEHWANLVALKPTGSRPPLFAVTAGDGNVVSFGPLARCISAEQPLYALQPSGLDGQAAMDDGIEAMAARCIEEIRTVQAHGPYLLAGRCNGATAAYEIAQRLHAAGEEVALLAVLDSDPPLAGPPELEPGLPVDHYMEAAWIRARDSGQPVPERGEPAAFAAWLRGDAGASISRYGYEVWHWREDLRERWPEPLREDAGALLKWLWESGVTEQGIQASLLVPGPYDTCRTPDGRCWDWAMAAAWDSADREPSGPLSVPGWKLLREWLLEPVDGGPANRYLLAAAQRPDLQAHFAEPLDAGLEALRTWAWTDGVAQGLDPDLLPPPPGPLPRLLRLSLLLRRAGRTAEPLLAELIAGRAQERLRAARDRAVHRAERGLGRPLPRARRRIEDLLVEGGRRARESYRAAPWPGKIVLITSAQYEHKPAYLPWPERAGGGLERHLLPLGHVEMLRDPGAALLAECLDRCIDAALKR